MSQTCRGYFVRIALIPVLLLCAASPAYCQDDLAALWNLAVANNPALREAAAEVDASRGRLLQAGKYPNPRFAYRESVLGTFQAPAGDLSVEAIQEIVTAGKRRLDIAVASRGADVASVALERRKFEVLTAVRRAYYDYLSWAYTEQVSKEIVAGLEQAVEISRRQVEEAKIRPRTDLLRLQAVLAEARITEQNARINRVAGWWQLAAEVGVPGLPIPDAPADSAGPFPEWVPEAVLRRVLETNSNLKQAAIDTERSRLEMERARADAVPNFSVGGGYSNNFPEHQQGGTLAFEVPLPVWDRKQGRIQEAQARWAKAQAAERSMAARLTQETAEAFGRYQSARQRAEQLTNQVLPQLEESANLVRKGYQAGAVQLAFADVLLAEQSKNDARLRLAESRRELGRAVADLKGLMQLDIGENLGEAP
jgi:outer membrane protein, heavy metal efflux system